MTWTAIAQAAVIMTLVLFSAALAMAIVAAFVDRGR